MHEAVSGCFKTACLHKDIAFRFRSTMQYIVCVANTIKYPQARLVILLYAHSVKACPGVAGVIFDFASLTRTASIHTERTSALSSVSVETLLVTQGPRKQVLILH